MGKLGHVSLTNEGRINVIPDRVELSGMIGIAADWGGFDPISLMMDVNETRQ